MNCVRCGSELPKGATICSRCGCKNEMVEHSRIKEIIIFVMTMVSEFLILQNLLFILEDVKDYIKDIFKSAEFSFSAEMSLLFAVGILISIAVTIMYIVKFLRNSADCVLYCRNNRIRKTYVLFTYVCDVYNYIFCCSTNVIVDICKSLCNYIKEEGIELWG